jgi:hypothetical protein
MAADALPELLDAELSQGVDEVEVVEETIDFGDLAGPEHTAERTAFAELLAGTEDKKSRAYKAARRNVERWVKGRRPVTVSVRQIVTARRQQSERVRAFRLHGGEMRVQVSWYAERKREWLPPQRWVHVRQRVMREVVRAWAAGALERAAGVIWREFLEQYNVPNIRDWMRDVIVTDLRLEPSRR